MRNEDALCKRAVHLSLPTDEPPHSKRNPNEERARPRRIFESHMMLYQFYQKYGNLPYGYREKYVNLKRHGVLTPDEIYSRLRRIEREMRPLESERDDLLKIAEEYFESLPKPKIDLR